MIIKLYCIIKYIYSLFKGVLCTVTTGLLMLWFTFGFAFEVVDNGTRRPCSLYGYWYNQLGSELFITAHQDNSIVGSFRQLFNS